MTTRHVVEAEALDRTADQSSRVDRVYVQSIASRSRTWLFKEIITVLIKWRATDIDRQIAIQGAKTHAFHNASHQASSGPSIKIERLRLNQNGPRWTISS